MSDGRDTERVAGLGDLLKAARQRKGLTLKGLAEVPNIGVSATFLSRVERNEALPSDELLVKLAHELGVDATSALMQLFREKSSPEVREYVPLPAVLKLNESGAGGGGFAGLERIAEPMSQILDMHRELIQDNRKLREQSLQQQREIHALSAEMADKKSQFLPDVNRFLATLCNYECELVKREVHVSRSGDASIKVTVEGVSPNREPVSSKRGGGSPKRAGRPLKSLSHSVFLPQAVDGSLKIDGHSANFEILEKPEDLEVENEFNRESPERGTFMISFPDGFHWTPNSGKLSYSFSYRLERAFVMTLEEAKAVYGRHTVHDSPLEWSTCFINKPCRRLEISLTFPEGYSPNYVDRFVWFTDTSFLESDYNLADRLLLDPEDGIDISEGQQTTVRLRAKSPILGFSYGIVWQPLPRRQFLSLKRDTTD